MDRMIAYYPHGFKNCKWYLRFFHLLNMNIVNAWIFFGKTCDHTRGDWGWFGHGNIVDTFIFRSILLISLPFRV